MGGNDMDDDATMPRWGVAPGRLFRALVIAAPAAIVLPLSASTALRVF